MDLQGAPPMSAAKPMTREELAGLLREAARSVGGCACHSLECLHLGSRLRSAAASVRAGGVGSSSRESAKALLRETLACKCRTCAECLDRLQNVANRLEYWPGGVGEADDDR